MGVCRWVGVFRQTPGAYPHFQAVLTRDSPRLPERSKGPLTHGVVSSENWGVGDILAAGLKFYSLKREL